MTEHIDPPESSLNRGTVTWDRPDHLVTLDIAETARRAGLHRWVSTRLFELLGTWVTEVPEVGVKQRLGVHANRLAWHAELWLDRLPELAEMSPEAMTAADDQVRTAIDVAASTTPDQTIEKLVGAYRVLIPRQAAAYRFQRAQTSEITDAPTARVLSLVLADVREIWTDGEMMIHTMLQTSDDVERAARHHSRVEAAITTAGGVCGPGSIG